MEFLVDLLQGSRPFLTAGLTLTVVIVILFVVRSILERRLARVAEGRFRLQLIMLLLLAAALVLVIVVLAPEELRPPLLGLVGIVLSAAIALSSTTFLGNIMAGIMLRAVKAFGTGDFVRVDEHFGRVTERGLFHVEIQTEDRDLTTLPNMYLVTHPVTVVHSEGTIVSAQLSLGYDVSRTRIEELLLKAAHEAGLLEPFVQILDLGDFSVTYRIAGLYPEVKHILSKRSELRAKVLDVLHVGEIEIVSPAFMNTRAISEEKLFIPVVKPETKDSDAPGAVPESIVFDKAEHAQHQENLEKRHFLLGEELKKLEERLGGAKEDQERQKLQAQKERLQLQRERLERFLEKEAEAGNS